MQSLLRRPRRRPGRAPQPPPRLLRALRGHRAQRRRCAPRARPPAPRHDRVRLPEHGGRPPVRRAHAGDAPLARDGAREPAQDRAAGAGGGGVECLNQAQDKMDLSISVVIKYVLLLCVYDRTPE